MAVWPNRSYKGIAIDEEERLWNVEFPPEMKSWLT